MGIYYQIPYHRVVSLDIFWRDSQTSSRQNDKFIDHILQFTRLQYLILHDINNVDLQFLLEKSNYMELISLTIDSRQRPSSKTFKIVSLMLVKSNLQKLRWNNSDYNAGEMSWPEQCKLKYLSINSCLYSQYLHILHQLPYLETLQLTDCIMDMNNTFKSSSNLLFNSQLACLIITDCSLSTEHFRSLILKTLKLRELKIIFRSRMFTSVIDTYEWEKLVRIELNFLNRLEFFLSYTISADDTISFNSIIAPFRELFWLNEKRWFTVCESIIHSDEQDRISLFTIPITMDIPRFYGPLKELDLGYNRITDDGAKSFSQALQNNNVLEIIDLSGNRIGGDGARYLALILENNTTILELSLVYNRIEAEGAKYIADALQENTTLRMLNLDDNEIGAAGAHYLAEVLRNNKTLEKLNLKSSRIEADGAKYLADALRENTTLKMLDLSDNEIGAAGAHYLAEVLRNNKARTLTKLYLKDIPDQGGRYYKSRKTENMASILRNSTTLSTINLAREKIGSAGAQHIGDALRTNTVIFFHFLVF
ncbi:unnamed protein product [Adineta steineri]|uniref:Uncharacterized protein n=1 Tax=Adineta steineri TaxID=433720 RepID=A0A813VBI5_9BILA|nr:unnamed protein product [Adineta steineri]CAF0821520.1 unnamed protein product [Adineta steineri]CAF0838616.1 unnamed protein product [Adineta steineri]